ncbi:hypothetical protein OJ997_18610 [Solirubrobacter phytolaccae]|uniref:Uncharacterized protein n=1 Tax=Solirubrobacter phytolaccae TaxID=1404360 RepID=A0A9X3NAB8_9ACTN|nr:hypothetical protein [Solirubrobacter phytolaccae]MDA0182326.1 hypothetical protein [Solirubrobacter phytolaccae]
MRVPALAALLGLLAAAPAQARPGDLDRTFGKGGRLAVIPWDSGGSTRSLALVDGVRPLLSVYADRAGDYAPALLRFSGRGRLLATTDVPHAEYDPPLLADGYSLTPDVLSLVAGQEVQVLTRIGSSHSVALPAQSPKAFGVDRRGRVTVVSSKQAERFLPDGRRDLGYGEGGIAKLTDAKLERVVAALVRRDGRVYASGGRRIVGLDTRGRILRRLNRGKVTVPGVPLPGVSAFAEGPGGTVLVAGPDRFRDAWVGRLHADGRPDRRFGKHGWVTGRRDKRRVLRSPQALTQVDIASITRDRRGRIVLGGSRIETEFPWQATVVRLSSLGRVDRSFATGGRKFVGLGDIPGVDIIASAVTQVAVDRRGRIVVAGTVFDDDAVLREDLGTPYPGIARLRG